MRKKGMKYFERKVALEREGLRLVEDARLAVQLNNEEWIEYIKKELKVLEEDVKKMEDAYAAE